MGADVSKTCVQQQCEGIFQDPYDADGGGNERGG